MQKLGLILYGLAALSAVAAGLALVIGPEWIEELTGLEPDGGSGSLEFVFAVAPAGLAMALGLLGYAARRTAEAG